MSKVIVKKCLRFCKTWLQKNQKIWLTTGGVAVGVILLRLTGGLQTFEWMAYDLGYKLRLTSETTEERILIVEINEPDIRALNDWPMSDQVMTQLIQTLNAEKPLAIGIDIYRDIPVPPGHEQLLEVMENTPNLVMIEKLEDEEEVFVAPPPIENQSAIAFNNVVADGDGKVRRSVLFWHTPDGKAHTSFSLKLALLYLQAHDIKPKQAKTNPEWMQLGEAVFDPLQPYDGGYVRLDTRGYQTLVNFRHPSLFETVSMRDVLDKKVDPELIRDRIIIVGSTAPSLKDFSYIPYSLRWFDSLEPIYGVELHANFASYLISAAFGERPLIQTLDNHWEWFWIVLWSSLGTILVVKVRSLLWSSLGLVVAVVTLSGFVYGAFLVGWWLPVVPPLLGLLSSAMILTAYLAYQEEELKRSMEFLRSVIDNIPDPIFVKDQNQHWIILNQAFCNISGYPLDFLLGKTARDIFPPEEAKIFEKQDHRVFQSKTSQEHEEKFTDKDGNTYLTATKRSLHQDAAGNIFLVGVMRDITERKRIEEELRRTTVELSRSNAELMTAQNRLQRLAYQDSLTGLANRKSFYERLDNAIAWGKKNQQRVGVLYLDLDGFKQVNDTLGHHIGDLLLKAVAGRIKNSLRESDTVARLGGDEFTVILPGIKQDSDVIIVANKIADTLSKDFALEGHRVKITVSVGSSVYPRDGEQQDLLINLADHSMYKAKELNRSE